jgi:hypothetical protein
MTTITPLVFTDSKQNLLAQLKQARDLIEDGSKIYVCNAVSSSAHTSPDLGSQLLRSWISIALGYNVTAGVWLSKAALVTSSDLTGANMRVYRLAWIDSMIQNIHDTGTIFTADKLKELNNANA